MKSYIELFFQLKPHVQIVMALLLLALLLVIITNHSTEENFVNLLLVFQYFIGGNLNRDKGANTNKH